MDIHREIVRPFDWSLSELPSLSGKVALVTGANSLGGIGGNIAHQLALKGAKVYVGARSLEKANAGIKAILSQSPSINASSLKPFVADIGNYPAVKDIAEKLLQEEQRLDILVNNAAILPVEVENDSWGVSTTMGTNYLGPFLLTKLLLPLMEKTAKEDSGNDVRIVNVASTGHYFTPPGAGFASLSDWNNTFDGIPNQPPIVNRYAFSKTANILFSRELQRRLSAAGVPILVTAPHPGAVSTEGAGRYVGVGSEEWKSMISPYEGALTPLWCAAHPEVRRRESEFRGKYVMPFGGLKETTELAASEEEARTLWETSERVLEGIFGP